MAKLKTAQKMHLMDRRRRLTRNTAAPDSRKIYRVRAEEANGQFNQPVGPFVRLRFSVLVS